MSKKGVSKISGNTSPQAGDKTTYTVDSWYSGTPAEKRNLQHVTWELFKKRKNGQFTKANIVKKGDNTFTFGESVVGDTFKLFGYLYHPEGQGLLITPRRKLIPKIEKIELLHVDNTVAKKFNVNDRVRCKAICTNMHRKKVIFRLWEDDANGKKQDGGTVPIESSIPIEVNEKGQAYWEFTLIKALIDKAKNGEADLKQFEFFVSVEYYPHKRHNSPSVYVDNPDYKHQIPPENNPANNNSGTSFAGAPSGRNSDLSPPHNPSVPAATGNQSSTTSPQTVEPVSTQGTAVQDLPIITNPSSSRTPSQVNPGPKIEGLIDAYFARKEYTKKTGEVSGTLEYEIGSNGNKTSTDAEKEKIAKIILEKQKVKDLSKKKEYTTLEAIKAKLTKAVYNKGEKITFQTFKLGEEFKRIASAPLEDKVYLVASSYLLEGKNAKIIIKEKDGLIKGSADAVLPALEITEAQMEQSEPLKETERTEKTEFSGTIKKVTTKNTKGEETKSEMLIIPIQLRPKSDDDLKIWKEKIAKGKKDGTHTYKANKPFTIGNEQEKNQIADTITSKSNKALGGTHQVFKEDVIKLLNADGRTVYNEVKDIPKYKKEPELLYLHVTAQGTTQHDQKFLNREGVYFEIGKKCDCEARIRAFMRTIRVAEGTGEYVKGTKSPRDPQLGYTTWFSGQGNNFSDLSTHPQTINCNKDRTLCSSAAGAYQIMGWKFDELNGLLIRKHNDTFKTVVPHVYNKELDLARTYNAKGFSQVSQDRLCVIILDAIGAIESLLNDNVEQALDKSKGTWVSLPGATAGQPTAKMQETLDYYNEFLDKELSGETNLHIEPGFLHDFGYEDEDCQCYDKNSADWHHPLDTMELRGWYSETQWTPGKSDFHGRTGGKHDGLDLYAPVGTTIYACFDGEVTYLEDAGGYGHRIFLEGKYKGKKYYLMYSHLSEYKIGEVKKGDPIGKTGQSGNANGQPAKMAHLHFEVRSVKMRKPAFSPLTEIEELGRDVNLNPNKESQNGL